MKQTVARLLVEAALIVFSVLFAFWIDDRNQAAEDEALKTELLDRVYTEIVTDSIAFNYYLTERATVRRSLLTLMEYVDAGSIREDSLAALLSEIEWFPKYQSNNYTYTSIINSGLLRLFERDGVFMNISRYYSENTNIISYTDMYMDVSHRYLAPYLNLHFDRRLNPLLPRTQKPRIDLKRFTSKEFINILYNLRLALLVDNFGDDHRQNQSIVLGDIRRRRSR
jgi:hypothetical protein